MKCIQSTRTKRRGYTLVEMLAVIGLTSIVMGLVGMLLHGAWRVQRAMSTHGVVMESIARLADQFRDDVHQASSVAASAEPSPLGRGQGEGMPIVTLQWPANKQVSYQFNGEAIERLVQDGDKTVQRENYTLPAEATVSATLDRIGTRQTASLLIRYPLGVGRAEFSDQRELRIDAVVGLSPGEIVLGRNQP